MINRRLRGVLLLMIGALWSVGAGLTARAQGENTIVFGQTVEGRITNESFRTVYTFQGTKGEIIDAILQRVTGNLDPVLLLLGQDNSLIARSPDAGVGDRARLVSVALPDTGVFFLVATRFGGDRGLTTGQYSLSLARVGIAADPRIASNGTTPIQYGDNVVNELTDQEYERYYSFGALRGDIITVSMQRISGDLDALLILADADGNVLRIDDDDPNSPGTLDAAIVDLRIKRSANYIIAASRFGREGGQSRGGFSLTLTRLDPNTLGLTSDKAVLLDYGMQASGSIDAANINRYYLVEAKRGDVLTVEATRTRGNLDPIVLLYTADLRPLVGNDAGARGRFARITAYRVPRDGEYIIIVSRFNRQTGVTAGDFSLKVDGKPAS
jgi:hypothetical protein